jgi:hypothetical protein
MIVFNCFVFIKFELVSEASPIVLEKLLFFIFFRKGWINLKAEVWPDHLIKILSHRSTFRFNSSKDFIRNQIFGCAVVRSFFIIRNGDEWGFFKYLSDFVCLDVFSGQPFVLQLLMNLWKSGFMPQNI